VDKEVYVPSILIDSLVPWGTSACSHIVNSSRYPLWNRNTTSLTGNAITIRLRGKRSKISNPSSLQSKIRPKIRKNSSCTKSDFILVSLHNFETTVCIQYRMSNHNKWKRCYKLRRTSWKSLLTDFSKNWGKSVRRSQAARPSLHTDLRHRVPSHSKQT
jgi:hypothetical protein